VKALTFASIGLSLGLLTNATLADNTTAPWRVEVLSAGTVVAIVTLPPGAKEFVTDGDDESHASRSLTIKLEDGTPLTISGQQIRMTMTNGDVLLMTK